MSFKDDNYKPPTSKEEAWARRVRPPLERYDPDKLSYWSITMTLAWIIWGEIDAVRDEWDDYRNECADWRDVPDATARAKLLTPELQKDLQDLQKESPWHLYSSKPSGWNTLPASEHIRPRVAIDELWKAAGEGRIKATAIEYKNAKALLGDPVEIPAHYWPHLKRADDRLTGKPILSDDNGRVYREVQFLQLVVKELWPKSPSLSGEPLEHVEKPEPEQTRPAEPESLKPAAWFDDARKDNQQHKNESQVAYAGRLHDLMQKAHAGKHVTKLWARQTLLRRLFRDKRDK